MVKSLSSGSFNCKNVEATRHKQTQHWTNSKISKLAKQAKQICKHGVTSDAVGFLCAPGLALCLRAKPMGQRNTDSNRDVPFSSTEDSQQKACIEPEKQYPPKVVIQDRKRNYRSAWQPVRVLLAKCHSCGYPTAVGYGRVVFAILDIAKAL